MKKIIRLIKRAFSKPLTMQQYIEGLRQRGVEIGENVDIIHSNLDYDHGYLIKIGNNVTITNSTILTHDASLKKTIGYSKIGRVEIGDDVFIGFGCVVLPNVKIGNRVIIGAGSVVTRDIPDDSVAVGTPAKVIGSYTDTLNKNKDLLNKAPTYSKENKSAEDIKEIITALGSGGIGFDL